MSDRPGDHELTELALIEPYFDAKYDLVRYPDVGIAPEPFTPSGILPLKVAHLGARMASSENRAPDVVPRRLRTAMTRSARAHALEAETAHG